LLFSNPQNPTGRCWTLPELEALGALAVEFDFLLFSDEIHSDLISPGGRHISLADLPELSSRTLVFAGPNKTFNLAGLPISHVVVRDATLRRRLKRTIESDFFDQPNVLSMTAALTAYQQGAPWLDHLLGVIQANYRRLEKFLAGRGLEAYPMEATYLAWVDCTPLITQLGLASDKELAAWMEETVRVKPTAGSLYGNGGRNHLRFNLATPPALLQQALDRLDAALPKRP
jgi:cystathionine beta-lyase